VLTTDPLALLLVLLTAMAGGAVNSIAGGGTLLTFPMLIWLDLDGKAANATSTIGLWPGSLGGACAYRRDLAGSRTRFWPFFLASFTGGVVGSLVFLWTGTRQFNHLVPWLILAATILFASQSLIRRSLAHTSAPLAPPLIKEGSDGESAASPLRWPLALAAQFLVGVYGGYFGAGIGILMLAVLGLAGLNNIHQMNGLKNIAATFINGITIVIFVAASLISPVALRIDWGLALAMMVGACIGGYGCAGLARRIGAARVRRAVVLIGLISAVATAYQLWFRS
jgi:uncharacterized membrane protein YfcA